MPTKSRGAGDLRHRVAFDRRAESADGYGSTTGEWQEQFQCAAGFLHLRGGESVMAGRLQGEHLQIVVVRASSQTRQADTGWRIRDVRAGTVLNVRDVTPSEDRAWIDFLCQSGMADG
jgi:SPP1 family predicted phage head-tail adaptor